MLTFRRNYFRILAGILRFYYLKIRFNKSFISDGLVRFGKHSRVFLDKGKLFTTGNIVFAQDTFIDIIGIVKIGAGCSFNDSLRLVCHHSITIGNHVTVASHVSFFDHDHAYDMIDSKLILNSFTTMPIRIGNYVWIGENAVILKGVTIGDNVIIGAGSIVTSDIPSDCIAAGNPAKVIKRLII